MPTITFPTHIRSVRDDEYEAVGHLHAAAVQSDPMLQLIYANVDPDEDLQAALWMDEAKATVAKGDGTVVVMERTDTNEIIGLAWWRKFSDADPPLYPDTFPKGTNITEFESKERPVTTWLEGLVKKHREFLCKHEWPL